MGKTKKNIALMFMVAIIATLFGALVFPQSSEAAVGINQQISFQGKLVNTNGTNLPDGTYNLQFKVYQDGNGCVGSGTTPCGGTLKWTESRLVSASQGVTVTAGTFQVNLGSVNAFASQIDWNQDSLWLSINVGGTGSTATYDGEMTPFIRLTSVPYALNSNAVGGLTASQLVQLQTGTPGTAQTGNINISGTIISGSLRAATLDTAMAGVLSVGATNATGITLSKNTTITSGQTLTVGGQTVFSGTGILQSAAMSGSYTGITGVGTVTAGTWNATAIAPGFGGTGITTYTVGDLLYATGTTSIGKLASIAAGSCLKSNGVATAPIWGTCGAAGGVTTVGTYSTTNVAADGATISGNTITFQAAGINAPGMITAGAQSLSGSKTLFGAITINGDTTSTPLVVYSDGSSTTASFTNVSSGLGLEVDGSGVTKTTGTFQSLGNLTATSGFNATRSFNSVGVQSQSAIIGANINTISGTTSATSLLINMSAVATTGSSTITGILFSDKTVGANLIYNGISFGTGYNSILSYNGNGLINGTGNIQPYALTGATSYAVGDLLYASTTTTLAKLSAVAAGSCLKSNGVGAAPVYGTCATGTTPTLQAAYDGGKTITQIAAGTINFTTGTTVPTTDQLVIDNTGSTGVTTAGVNGVNVKYKGGAAAIEASGMRIDYQPGSTTGGTWSGMRIVANATGPAAGVTSYGLKLEGPTAAGAVGSNSTALYVGSGWDVGLNIASGGMQLASQASDPATPAAGQLRIYAKTIGGRVLPKWIGPSGVDTPFQASFGFNRIAMSSPGAGSTTTVASGTTLTTSFGTVGLNANMSNPTPTSTNLMTSTRRTEYTSTATAGGIGYQRQNVPLVYRGNASGLGGFYFTTRFGTGALQTGNRAFVGLSSSTAIPTNVDPLASTADSKMGVGINASTGNWFWISNVAGVAPTTVDLGTTIPVNTTGLYELIIFSAPNSTTITYRLKNLSTNVTLGDVTTSTNIPANTVFMAPYMWITNNTTAAAATLESGGWYLESDN